MVELFDETHGAKLAKTPRLAKRGCFFGVNRIPFAPLSVRPAHMFGFGKKRSSEGGEEHRYYLLPGHGALQSSSAQAGFPVEHPRRRGRFGPDRADNLVDQPLINR